MPLRQGAQLGAERSQTLLLALAQLAGEFDDAVAVGPHAQRIQFDKDVGGQLAGAGAKFQHVALAFGQCLQHLRELVRHGAAEERRQFGRGDEVAAVLHAAAEFGRAAAVIAQAGRVERQFHVAVERKPAAGGRNGVGDHGEQVRGLRLRRLVGKR